MCPHKNQEIWFPVQKYTKNWYLALEKFCQKPILIGKFLKIDVQNWLFLSCHTYLCLICIQKSANIQTNIQTPSNAQTPHNTFQHIFSTFQHPDLFKHQNFRHTFKHIQHLNTHSNTNIKTHSNISRQTHSKHLVARMWCAEIAVHSKKYSWQFVFVTFCSSDCCV